MSAAPSGAALVPGRNGPAATSGAATATRTPCPPPSAGPRDRRSLPCPHPPPRREGRQRASGGGAAREGGRLLRPGEVPAPRPDEAAGPPVLLARGRRVD